jgi:hypothetical protein
VVNIASTVTVVGFKIAIIFYVVYTINMLNLEASTTNITNY